MVDATSTLIDGSSLLAVLDPADHALLVDDDKGGNSKAKRSLDINVPWLHKAEYLMSEKLSGV